MTSLPPREDPYLDFVEYLLGGIAVGQPAYDRSLQRMHWLATNLPRTFALLGFNEGWSELEEGLG